MEGLTTLESEFSEMVSLLAKDGDDIVCSLDGDDAHMLHMALGLAGEVGELIDGLKKGLIYGAPIDLDNVIEEMGDIEFYMEGLRLSMDINRDECLAANINKLATGENARYSEGYSDDAAQYRADKVA